MALAPREKYIAICVAALIGVYAIDSIWFSPMLARLDRADTLITKDAADEGAAKQLYDNSDRARRRWSEVSRGTMKDDASAAESQLLNSVRDYAQGADLALVSLKPDRAEKEKGFGRVTIRASATGTMAQVSNFLFALRTANVPVRVNDFTINARKDGADDLALQIGVSSLYNGDTPAPTPGRPAGVTQ